MVENVAIFEVSWEIANKVGGIYTVIKSKAAEAKKLGKTYIVIGPYFPEKSAGEFVEEVPPQEYQKPFEALKGQGIIAHFGKWLVDGEVSAILIDFQGFTERTNEIKQELWQKHHVDSLNTSYFEFDQPVVWATAAGHVIEAIAPKQSIAHCHEWLSAAALLYLKDKKIPTVFTTHATVLGRALSNSGVDIYDSKIAIDVDKAAYETGAHAKHQIEKAAAQAANVFTTVSEITSIEAERFLGRKADVLLLNGLNLDRFPTVEEAAVRHGLFKGKIKEFLIHYFFPYYSFDLENTLLYFLAGRYEFHAKGIDLFIASLGELNNRLKAEKSKKTVVAFLWVPANIRGIRTEVLENRTMFRDIKESLTDKHDYLMERLLLSTFVKNTTCDESYIFGQDLLLELQRKTLRFRKKGTPPLSTHELNEESADPILNAVKWAGLLNREEDRVKIVFYPIYLTGADNVLDLSYYEAMQGCHLGVFPSFYEPWGYTPVEAAALAVPSVTTDLSGFGRFIFKDSFRKKTPGIFVTKRLGVSDDKATADLVKVLQDFTQLEKHDRMKNKLMAKHIAARTDWSIMIKNYQKAYALGLK